MMTIKAFAELCGCSTQTLRYYDRIGLLIPARVDEWSGYRYYEERQAVDFVKIRNLQAADFAISEIRSLLTQPDEAVFDAFEAKIAAQQEKLQRIREIQQTYLREKSAMEKLLSGVVDYLLSGCRTPAVLEEFGYAAADSDRVMAAVRQWLEGKFLSDLVQTERVTLEVNGEMTEGLPQVSDKLAALPRDLWQQEVRFNCGETTEETTRSEVVWERAGWKHVREILGEIPPLTGDDEYQFVVCLASFPYPKDLSYGLFLVGVMMLERGAFSCRGCDVEISEDGQNRFTLLRMMVADRVDA